MRVVRVALIGACVGIIVPAFADAPDVNEVLTKAQAAVKALPAISYEAEYREESAPGQTSLSVAGKAMLVRGSTALPKLRVDASLLASDSKNAPALQLASDGTTVWLIDHGQKLFLRRQGPGTSAPLLSSPPAALVMFEFFAANPFADDFKVGAATYAGTQSVGGIDCHVIQVRYAGGAREVRWSLGTKDYLPRQFEVTTTRSAVQSKGTLTLKSLDVNPSPRDELFRLEQPAGYSAGDPPGPPPPLAAGTEAPDWSLKTPDDKTVALKELRGKVVVLDFWATWCGPCKVSMPGVQKLHERFKDKPVVVYGISTWERGGNPAEYMKQMKFTYGLLLKGDQVAQAYAVRGIPTFYVIGHDGKIVYADSGAGKDVELTKAVERALDRMK